MECPCEIIQDLIFLSVQGEASGESEEAVRLHISQCEACRQFYLAESERIAQWESEIERLEEWGIFAMAADALERLKTYCQNRREAVAALFRGRKDRSDSKS